MGDQCWESKRKISGNKFEGGGEVLVESSRQTKVGEKIFLGGAFR